MRAMHMQALGTRLINEVRRLMSRAGPRSAVARAIDLPFSGLPADDADAERWALVALAESPSPEGLLARWTMLAETAPGHAVDGWFRITRALARHLDPAAVAHWIFRTREIVIRHAPDTLRVERYVDLFVRAYPREIASWRDRRRAVRVRQTEPAALVVRDLAPHGLPQALAGRLDPALACRVILQNHSAAPVTQAAEEVSGLARAQFAALGWTEAMLPPAPAAELYVLPEARFVAYREDNRGGIVFDGDSIVQHLCNEHHMLDMTGHAPAATSRHREPVAFAPVSACPLNHYHELMDTFASLMFLDLLPEGTPVVVPKRYEVLRPLYEAAGLEWSRLREYADVAEIRFDRVIAPAPGAHRAGHAAFFSRIGAGLLGEGVTPHRRLYLSRRRTPNRPLANERDIEALVQRFGFEIVHPQEMDFIDQCRMFAAAEMIVGPHGAAFANLPFAPRGTQVIELKCVDYRVPVTWEMASTCGQRFLPLVGSGFRDAARGDFSWTIDPGLVETALARLAHPATTAGRTDWSLTKVA